MRGRLYFTMVGQSDSLGIPGSCVCVCVAVCVVLPNTNRRLRATHGYWQEPLPLRRLRTQATWSRHSHHTGRAPGKTSLVVPGPRAGPPPKGDTEKRSPCDATEASSAFNEGGRQQVVSNCAPGPLQCWQPLKLPFPPTIFLCWAQTAPPLPCRQH